MTKFEAFNPNPILKSRTYEAANPRQAITTPELDAKITELLAHPYSPIAVARKIGKDVGFIWWRIQTLGLKVRA